MNGKECRALLDQELEGRTTVAEVIKDLPLYDQLLNRGQLMGKLMSRNLIEVVRRQDHEISRLQASEFREVELHTQTIDQRDHAQELANKLVAAVAKRLGVVLGEHTSWNCPWTNALAALEGEYVTDSDRDCELEGLKARLATAIELTPAEIQSRHSRVSWAEGLILQLPETHDGRNSWLMNYGSAPGALVKP